MDAAASADPENTVSTLCLGETKCSPGRGPEKLGPDSRRTSARKASDQATLQAEERPSQPSPRPPPTAGEATEESPHRALPCPQNRRFENVQIDLYGDLNALHASVQRSAYDLQNL
jgi:hypothetical protein